MDQNPKHTPAPWHWSENRDGHFTIIENLMWRPLARTFGNWFVNKETNHANARLIAAAPDLLAALENLFEHCVMIHKHWGDGDNTKQADAAITQAQDAIKKARGEQNG